MPKQEDCFNDRWLDRLDEIATGAAEPSPTDDELLRIAGQLNAAFAPLRELDAPARAHRHRLGMRLRSQLAASPVSPARRLRPWLIRPLIVAAAILLFVLLGPGLIFELNLAGYPGAHHTNSQQSWQATDLPSDLSFAIAPPRKIPHGMVLLLPLNLPPNAYLISINTRTYGSNAPIHAYLVYTQGAQLYESPAQTPAGNYITSAYTRVQLGSFSGILLRTRSGQNRIEWYQAGLLCDLVSIEPVTSMIAMIQHLQLVTY